MLQMKHTLCHMDLGACGGSETQTVKDDAALWFIFRHKYFMAPEPLVTGVPSFTAFLLSKLILPADGLNY